MKNKIYYGDNLQILRKYIKDESVDLIYLDPPFNSKKQYNIIYKEPNGCTSKAQSLAFDDTWSWTEETQSTYEEIITRQDINPDIVSAIKAFHDMFGNSDLTAYLVMMTIRLIELHRILKPTGSIYLHCDPTASHYLKIMMDAIFGSGNFQNEIIWCYRTGGATKKRWSRKHDIILFYSKTDDFYFNCIKEREYYEKPFFNPQQDAEGRYYADVLPVDWWQIPAVINVSKERTDYPTQKPLALLEKIIKASCPPNGVVFDPFCGCYDGDTELLTESGWIKFKNLKDEKVAQLNPKTNLLEYVVPIAKQKYIHKGKMHHWKSTMFDILVTPNHNMYVSERKTYPKYEYTDYKFVNAEDVTWLSKIKRNCNGFIGESNPKIPKNIDPKTWCKFLGFWLGDGYINGTGRGYRIGIRQIKNNHEYIQNFLNEMNVKWKRNNDRYCFNDKEIHTYLKQCNTQPIRRIPQEVLGYSKELLLNLLEGLMIADGTKRDDIIRIYTISKQLSDDVSELMIKCGMCVTISQREPRTEKHKSSDGRIFYSKSLCYYVSGTTKRTESHLKRNCLIDWNDYVYCVTVPSHIIIIRRNGKVVFCGNCGTTLIAAQKLNSKSQNINRIWVGIDITYLAVNVLKQRFYKEFPGIEYEFEVDGEPVSELEAKKLAEQDKHQFAIWAITKIGGKPNIKKSGDKGVDGYYDFIDNNISKRGIIQVKGGGTKPSDIRDFCHTVNREKASIGIFITLEEPSRQMLEEATGEGSYTDSFKNKYKKISIITIEDLLKKHYQIPPPKRV